MIDGKLYSVGKGSGCISVMQEETLIGNIHISDRIRDDASHACKLLPNVILSSGDNEGEVSKVANELGIKDARSNQSPEEKLSLIRSLSNVAMVGDGINDSAALAAADLGIAVASSTGMADISSDIVLTRDGLIAAVDAIKLARKTRLTIRQNLVWAFGYNILAIPVAMGVLYTTRIISYYHLGRPLQQCLSLQCVLF